MCKQIEIANFKKKIVGVRNQDIFPVGMILSMIFNAFYEQCLNCVFSVHAICTAHIYFIIVTHTLRLSEKKHYGVLWRLKIDIITAIVTATIFVYKRTKCFRYCSAEQ